MPTPRPQIAPVPGDNTGPGWFVAVADRINRLLNGGMNVSDFTTVTLTPSATETKLVDSRITIYSHINLEPLTASAATARAALWYTAGSGSATLNHASDAAVDQTFSYSVLG
jgi:hypothetical protein